MQKLSAVCALACAGVLSACGSSGQACQTLTPEEFAAEVGDRSPSGETSTNGVTMRAYAEGGLSTSQTGSERFGFGVSSEGALALEHEGRSLYFRLPAGGETRLRVRSSGVDCSYHPE